MVLAAARLPLTGTTVAIASYDSTKINLGTLMTQSSDSNGTWCGPYPNGLMRPSEETTAINAMHPCSLDWSSTKTWIFYADGSAAGATRKFGFYEYTLGTANPVWKGSITVTFPTATNHTVRAIAPTLDTYSTGTVTVSGTAVTGASTAWQTARFATGARIGFGSTDPTQISTWYNISTITNDTSITLSSSAGSIGAGSSYVIEELRLIVATTNATTTNGGLFVIKGLNYSTFTTGSAAIAAAVSTDNVQGCFWLADAGTVTNTVAGGLAVLPKTSNTSHTVYVMDGTTTAKFYKYNVRNALTLASGKDTTSLIWATAASASLTGTINQNMSCVYAVASHGGGSGVGCIYFTTSTRVYRQVESSLSNGGTPVPADNMQEVPPGGTNTFPAAGAMSTISYSAYLDRFVIGCSSTTAQQVYVTQYNSATAGFDTIIPTANRGQNQLSGSANLPVAAVMYQGAATHMGASAPYQSGTDKGLIYLDRYSTTVAQNQMYVVPAGAHWQYAATTNQRIITPSIATTGASKFYTAYVNNIETLGGSEFGCSPHPLRMYYRTSGISDNSGSWTLLTDTADLSGASPANAIQFMLEFKIIGRLMVSGYAYEVGLIYESGTTIPSHLEWYQNDTDLTLTTGVVGFYQTATYGSVPNLQIDYYRQDTNANILSQASTGSTYGQFQYYDTGSSSWLNGNGTDTIGLRRRFVPTSATPANLQIYYTLKTV